MNGAWRRWVRPLFQRTIIRKILFSYLATNLLMLILLGIVTIRDSTASITREVTSSSYKVMEQAALGFSFNVEEAKRPLVMLAGNHSVHALLISGSQMGIEERIQHERNIAELANGITTLQSLISDILILGENGYFNNLDGRKSLRWDYPFAEQPWFRAVLSAPAGKGFVTLGLHKQSYYLPSNLSRYDKFTLAIAIPVRSYNRGTVGAVIANLDLQKINKLFELSSYRKNESILMVDDNRTILVHRDSAKIGTKLALPGIENIYRQDSGSFVAPVNGKEHLVIFHPTAVEGLRLLSLVPMEEIRAQSNQLKVNLAGFLYLCVMFNILIAAWITFRISLPFNRLLHTIDKLGEDSLYVVPKNYGYRELNLIGARFKELVGRIDQLVRQNYESQIALQEARLKSLQSQIHPHFLFNTLQLLQTEIVCGNTAESNHLILSLSNLLRYSMKKSEDIVELTQELQNVRDYLFIMNKKYAGRIAVDYHIPDPKVLQCKTIKLMMQPIVENAIVHGFGENPRSARIRIHILPVKKGVLVIIADNGAGMDKDRLRWLVRRLENAESTGESVGLCNVNHRIKLTFGSGYGIRIRSQSGRGTAVYIVLPES